MMISDIIFDFFGTLVAYDDRHIHQNFAVTYDFLTSHGFAVSYQQFVDGWAAAFQQLEKEAQITLREFQLHQVAQTFFMNVFGQSVDDVISEQLIVSYLAEWNRGVTYFDQVEAFLGRLSQQYRVSLISNTHYAPLVYAHLAEMGVAGMFTAVTLSATHGWRKPHASIFQDTLVKLSTAPQNGLYVGDNFHADYLGATNLSLKAVLIDPQNKHGVSEKLSHLFELEGYLERLTQPIAP
jgi:putative hydrolase of the HAD superfamily